MVSLHHQAVVVNRLNCCSTLMLILAILAHVAQITFGSSLALIPQFPDWYCRRLLRLMLLLILKDDTAGFKISRVALPFDLKYIVDVFFDNVYNPACCQ